MYEEGQMCFWLPVYVYVHTYIRSYILTVTRSPMGVNYISMANYKMIDTSAGHSTT